MADCHLWRGTGVFENATVAAAGVIIDTALPTPSVSRSRGG